MLKRLLFAASAVALVVAVPSLTQAKSINHLVTQDSLAQFCAQAGAGSETNATVTLPDGTTVTGTIECDAEDVAAGTGGDDESSVSGASSEDDESMSEEEGHRDGVHSGSGNDGEDHSAPGGDGNSDNSSGHDGGDGGGEGGDD